MTKTKEMIVDLEKQVNDKDFKGLTLKSQKDLVFLLSMIYDDREELRVQREKWVKTASKYQDKYLHWYNIYRLSFWKRLIFLFDPFSITDEVVEKLYNNTKKS